MASESILDKIERMSAPEGGCRVWQGWVHHTGYGYVAYQGRDHRVHRLVWELENGPLPGGAVVNHECGNRACVDVAHLEMTNQADNVQYRTVMNANNTSGYRNVYRASGDRWRAQVEKNRVAHHLGYFDTAEEAARAAEAFRREHFTKEFSDWKGK